AALHRARYASLTLLSILFVYLPLLLAGLDLLLVAVSSLIEGLCIEALVFSGVLFFGAVLVGLLAVGTVPRLLRRFVKPDTVYPLYGLRYTMQRVTARLGRLEFFPLLFGDSSYIVHYLSWLGYRLRPVEQTGSNFGSEVITSNPLLTSVGSGTMVADGLNVVNDEVSSTSFRVCRAAIGPRT